MYNYKLSNIRVVDGDTIKADIDLGFGVTIRRYIRLAGIDAPEMHGVDKAKGITSKQYLEKLIEDSFYYDFATELHSKKDSTGKYGRVLGEIWGEDAISNKRKNFNMVMIQDGYAKPYGRK